MTFGDAIVFIFLFCVLFVVACITATLGVLLSVWLNPDADLMHWILGVGGFFAPYALLANFDN